MNNPQNTLQQLDLVDFHDLPIASLQIFADESTKLTIHALLFDESINDYRPLLIHFDKIEILIVGQIVLNKAELEIAAFDYEYDGNLFHGKILFLCGFAEAPFNIELSCGDIEVITEGYELPLTPISNGFHPSFGRNFCDDLEGYLCLVFDHSTDSEIQRFWCDGVSHVPFYADEDNIRYLSYEHISKTKQIETQARAGISGQEKYRLILVLEKKALSAYKAKSSLINVLPEVADANRIEIDLKNQCIKIRLY